MPEFSVVSETKKCARGVSELSKNDLKSDEMINYGNILPQFRNPPCTLFCFTSNRKFGHFLSRYIIWNTKKLTPKDLGE